MSWKAFSESFSEPIRSNPLIHSGTKQFICLIRSKTQINNLFWKNESRLWFSLFGIIFVSKAKQTIILCLNLWQNYFVSKSNSHIFCLIGYKNNMSHIQPKNNMYIMSLINIYIILCLFSFFFYLRLFIFTSEILTLHKCIILHYLNCFSLSISAISHNQSSNFL